MISISFDRHSEIDVRDSIVAQSLGVIKKENLAPSKTVNKCLIEMSLSCEEDFDRAIDVIATAKSQYALFLNL